ncbi:hypothetical protein HY626_03800 [Candidatus Uhrbacteria bacterium]|nr:hypothetical protein [Candidatus Uhrbacteria bacterium]
MIDLNPNAPPPAPAPHKSPAFIGVILLICVVAFFGGVLVTNLWEGVRDEQEDNEIIVVEQEESVDESEDETQEGQQELVLVSTDEELQIDWIDPTSQPAGYDDPVFGEAVCFVDVGETELWNECEENPNDPVSWSYKLGSVIGGVYDGRDFVMTTVPFIGFGTSYTSFYLLVDSDGSEETVVLDYIRDVSFGSSSKAITLAERFGEEWSTRLEGFVVDTMARVPEFEFEQIYYDSEGNEYFFTGYGHRLYSEQATALTGSTKSVSRTDGGTLRLYEPKRDVNGQLLEGQTAAGENQFFDVDEDGRVLFYDLRPPFFDYDTDKTGTITTYAMGRPIIRWNDGTVSNEQIYFKGEVGGCGFTNVTKVIPQSTIDSLGLVQTGEGFTEDVHYPVYEPTSYDLEYYDEAFTIVTWKQEEPKTYEDFEHPFFYYQDGLGRWVEFMSNEIVPPVECGKPVIYLYPESTMDMSVWVNPRGGFSYTEPDYGDGWDVTAYPDGHLVNRADGLEYPYLFWEGRGGLYPEVQTYWVVEQSGVESFLRETLARMNFNQVEIADFIEFWLPRMQSEPFYKIGFHGTNVMNELAPLSLSVKPDHIFRILMDYEGLDVWQPSKPPVRLPRANRDGFEVMEWGGVLR